MMTECGNTEMRDLLPDMAHGRLTPGSRASLVLHLEGCPACAHELELIQKVRGLLAAGTPAVDTSRILAGLAATAPVAGVASIDQAPSRRRHARFAVSRWRIAAAVTLLAIGGGSGLLLREEAALVGEPGSTAVAEGSAGLAMTGALADLSESELEALVGRLGEMEALPAVEVESDLRPVSGSLGPADSTLSELGGL